MKKNEDSEREQIEGISDLKPAIKIIGKGETNLSKQAIKCFDPTLNLNYAISITNQTSDINLFSLLSKKDETPTKIIDIDSQTSGPSIVRAVDTAKNKKNPNEETTEVEGLVTKVEFTNFILFIFIDGKPKKAGNAAFKIIDRITRRSCDTGEDDVIIYLCELMFYDPFSRKLEKKIMRVTAMEIMSSRWIEKKTGGSNRIESDFYQKYLDYLLQNPSGSSCLEFTYPGWHMTDGKLHYVIDNGYIGQKCDNCYSKSKFIYSYLPEKVATKGIFNEILKLENISKNKSNARTILIFSHLAIMQRIFIEAQTRAKFLVAIIGPTNSRKTSCIWPLTKVFDGLKDNRPMIQFNSTQKALEEALASSPDSVIPLDDIQVNTQKSAVDLIVRIIGDGQQKKRSENYETIKREIAGLPIFTGETINFLQLSSITRIVQINLDRFEIQNDWLDHFNKQPLLLATHFYDFIHFLTKNMQYLLDTLRNRIEERRKHYFGHLSVGRYAENLAFLEIVVETLFEYSIDRNFLSKQDADFIAWEYKKSMKEVISMNSNSLGESDYKCRIFSTVHESIQNDNVKIYLLNQVNVEESEKITENPQNTTLIAFANEKYVFISAETIHNLLENELDEMGRTLTTKHLIDYFLEFKLLGLWERNRNTMKLPNIKGHQKRYLAIKKNEFDFIVERFNTEQEIL